MIVKEFCSEIASRYVRASAVKNQGMVREQLRISPTAKTQEKAAFYDRFLTHMDQTPNYIRCESVDTDRLRRLRSNFEWAMEKKRENA